MEITVLNGQSLFDVAVRTAGSAEAALAIAAANDLSVTDALPAGMALAVPEVVNKQVADYYRVNAIAPATDYIGDDLGEGVEYWEIEENFVIS
jgi:hypothetical protein